MEFVFKCILYHIPSVLTIASHAVAVPYFNLRAIHSNANIILSIYKNEYIKQAH